MAWRRPGDKPLSEPMMVRLPTHICVTRPQWVKVHDDIMTCRRFLHHWSRWIFHIKGTWCGFFVFALMSAWTNCWTKIKTQVKWDGLTLCFHDYFASLEFAWHRLFLTSRQRAEKESQLSLTWQTIATIKSSTGSESTECWGDIINFWWSCRTIYITRGANNFSEVTKYQVVCMLTFVLTSTVHSFE